MTPRTEQVLNQYAAYFDLKVEYVDLPDNVSAFLQPGPDPRYIFVSSRKTRSDNAFSIAHELGHYVMHHERPPRDIRPRYLKIQWTSKLMSKLSRLLSRWVRRKFDAEWEADLWAFLFLFYIGATDDVFAFIESYPKKDFLFWCTVCGIIYCGIKRRIQVFSHRLFYPVWTE